MSKVIGIDLGTGNSAVAVIENGKATVIANAEGKRTTPSVVSINASGERKIGDAAKRQMVMEPKTTISSIKRFMGSDWNDADVQKMIKMVTYDVKNDNGKPRVILNGKEYSPEEISSFILSAMKKVAEDYYGEEIKDAVITCPAWFNDTQRQATKLAGELAGLNVLRIINEPTAAILSSDIDVKNGDKLIMVSDIGQGTSDMSLCELSDVDGQLMVEVLASYGDVFLGGQNFDNAIVNWMNDEFKKDNGVDLKKDPMAYSRLIEAAEKAKCELSSSAQTEINLPYITAIDGQPKHLVMTLTRAKYEQLTTDLVEKIVDCCEKCLEKGHKTASDLNEILLVGGMTRSLNIQDALSKKFNVPLDHSVNPDEAVALGAAIQANIIVGGEGAKDLLLLDVTPISLGIETEGRLMTKLIEANTTIPIKKTETFTTAVDNQPAVSLVVLQGERPMASDNKVIGRFDLDGIAPAPRGIPQIEVTFNIDTNGILTVSAKDKATGKEQHITIDNQNSLSQDEIDRIKADAEKYAEEDKKKTEEINKFNSLESYVYNIKNFVNDEKTKSFINEDDKTKLNDLFSKADDAIKSRNINDLESVKTEIENIWNPIAQKLYANAQQAQGQAQNSNSSSNPFGDAFSKFTQAPNQSSTSETTTQAEDVPFEETN